MNRVFILISILILLCGGGTLKADKIPASKLKAGQMKGIIARTVSLSFSGNGQQINNLVGRGVVLADFNGDSKLDAFTVNFGDGQGRMAEPSSFAATAMGRRTSFGWRPHSSKGSNKGGDISAL